MKFLSYFAAEFKVYAIEKGVINEHPIDIKITPDYLEFNSLYGKISPRTRAKHFNYSPAIDGKYMERFNSKITVVIEDYNDTLLLPNFRGYTDYQFYCNLNYRQKVFIKTILRKFIFQNINIRTVFWEYVIVVVGSYYTVKGVDNLLANLKAALKVVLKLLSE